MRASLAAQIRRFLFPVLGLTRVRRFVFSPKFYFSATARNLFDPPGPTQISSDSTRVDLQQLDPARVLGSATPSASARVSQPAWLLSRPLVSLPS